MFFKEVIKKLNIKSLIKRLSSNKGHRITFACVLSAVCIALVAFIYSMNHTVAVAVMCNGKTIGYVSSSESAENVEAKVKSLIYGDSYETLRFSFENNFISSGSISSETDIVDAIIDSLDDIERYTALYADGMLTAVAANETEMHSMINDAAKSYTTNGMRYIGISNSIEIREVYAKRDSVKHLASTSEDFCSGKSGIKFLTARYEEYEEEIPYETEVLHDATKIQGYSYTRRKGKNGLSFVNASVNYINGVRVSADVLSSEVIREPVTAKVVEGISEEAIQQVCLTMASEGIDNSMIFTFPCEITKKTYISSYWGDNRNHKGVDVASPLGSEIYAAHSGTVVEAGYHSQLGKYVTIDHGDGKTETMYAHCSKLLVSKGDVVTEGQVIALVGSTGRSTGNHLHFVVKIHGEAVNPAKYIGLVK